MRSLLVGLLVIGGTAAWCSALEIAPSGTKKVTAARSGAGHAPVATRPAKTASVPAAHKTVAGHKAAGARKAAAKSSTTATRRKAAGHPSKSKAHAKAKTLKPAAAPRHTAAARYTYPAKPPVKIAKGARKIGKHSKTSAHAIVWH